METRVLFIFYIIGTILLMSCSGKHSVDNSTTSSDSSSVFVSLSAEQTEYAGIVTTVIQKQVISDIIDCGGEIITGPNQEAMVSPPMKGYLRTINVQSGDYIEKGKVLAMLEHPGYVDLQQQFLAIKSQYDFYKEDFKRQGELSLENAASIKKMQQAENEFRKIEAQFYSLKKHLSFIGINPDSLTVENIRSTIYLRAPLSGYITNIEGYIGKFCPEEKSLFHIVSTHQLLLRITVDEKDISKVRLGQKTDFSISGDTVTTYKAIVRSVAHIIDDNNTIRIHANILDKSKDLMPGMFVKASILVNTDTVYALNNEAIFDKDGQHCIFIKTGNNTYQLTNIETGRESDNFTEVLQTGISLNNSAIVSSGAGYLFSKYLKEE